MDKTPTPETPDPKESQPATSLSQSQTKNELFNNVWIKVIAGFGSVVAFLGTFGGLLIENDQVGTVLEPIISVFTDHSNNQEIESYYRRASQIQEQTISLMKSAEAEVQDWERIENQWNNAIFELEKIPESHRLYSQAKNSIVDCQNYAKYSRALRLASLANQLKSQDKNNSIPVETWQRIEDLWGEAVDSLNAIDSDSKLFESVNDKVPKYQQNERYAQTAKAAAPWIQGVRAAQNAANAATIAVTFEDWTNVISLWKISIDHLSAVPDEYKAVVREDVINESLRKYQLNLSQAQQRQINL